MPVPIGELWLKGISIKGGIIGAGYKPTQLLLKNLIERDGARPSFVFDKEFKIEQAAEAFREFSDHKIVKAVFRFGNEWEKNSEEVKENGGANVRDPLQGEPVKKRSRRS